MDRLDPVELLPGSSRSGVIRLTRDDYLPAEDSDVFVTQADRLFQAARAAGWRYIGRSSEPAPDEGLVYIEQFARRDG